MSDETIHSKPPFRSALAQFLLLAAALVAVFMAGGARQGSSGIFFLVTGAGMVLLAPNRVVPWRYWIFAIAIFSTASLSLLPQSWFYAPPWRVALQQFQGLPPLIQVTPVPRETVYWLMLLLGALFVGLFSLGHPVRSGAKIYIALFGTLACAAYAGIALYAKFTGWKYPFLERGGWAPPDFGFFPNRNHTAAFLVTGSILSIGVIREAWMEKRKIVFLLAGCALGVCIYALMFQSASRGGVVFLVIGVVLWAAALGRNHLTLPVVVSCLVISSAMVWFFLASEGLAKERVMQMVGIQRPVPAAANGSPPITRTAFSDFRSKIFADTGRMIRDYPITGTGLGTYAYLYPFYARASLGEAVALHPESDWFMLMAEAGIPCVLLVLGLGCLLIRDMLPLQRSGTWPLRWGLISAALVAVLHGLVDVPIHRVELGWWVLVLAGLALGNPVATVTRDMMDPEWVLQRIIFAIGGAGFLALGGLLIGAQWFGLPPFPPYRAPIIVSQMRQLVAQGQSVAAVNLARSEIPLSPMSRGLYRELGFREIRNGGDPVVADAVFLAERALNPGSAQVPLDQGRLWLSDDPMRAALLWGEALKRHKAIEDAGGHANAARFFDELLGQSREYPGIIPILGRYAKISPETWLVWTERAPDGFMEETAKDTDFLSKLDLTERRKFLLSWWNRGNRDTLQAFIAAHPDWEKPAWPIRVNQLLAQKNFQGALEAVQKRYAINLTLPEVTADLPPDLAGQVAYYASKGNMVSAKRMIAESIQSQNAEGYRLQCILAVKTSDWPLAWRSMEGYLRETKKGDFP